MKSQRHSTCLSPRRCGCLRVSVCTSLPVCVCRSVCLSPSVSVWCVSGKSVCLSVCLYLPSPAHYNNSIRREGAMDDMDDEARDENNIHDCGCCGLQTLSTLLMSNSFLAIWLAMALVRCQAGIRSGRTKMRPSFCSRLYAVACTSLATVAGIVCSVGIELVRESDARCYSAVQQRALVILLLDHI